MTLDNKRPLTLCLLGLGGGGFQTETESIIELVDRKNVELVLVFAGPQGGLLRWNTNHRIKASYAVASPALMGGSRWKTLLLLPLNFAAAIKILATEDVNLVVGVGTLQIVPFSFACKLLGIEAWFYESITRVKKPSLTGEYVKKLNLTSRIFAYWPKVQAHFNLPTGGK